MHCWTTVYQPQETLLRIYLKDLEVHTAHPSRSSCSSTGLKRGAQDLWLDSNATTFSCLWPTQAWWQRGWLFQRRQHLLKIRCKLKGESKIISQLVSLWQVTKITGVFFKKKMLVFLLGFGAAMISCFLLLYFTASRHLTKVEPYLQLKHWRNETTQAKT